MPDDFSYRLIYNKETDYTYRWIININDVAFKLVILKWRVPKPLPKIINVRLDQGKHDTIRYWTNIELLNNSAIALKPIKENLIFHEDHTETYRYKAITINDNTAIEDVYIPKELTFHKAPHLAITVSWDY